MAFFANNGGAPPGAARNSLSQYPPKGTGFAGTKPPVPPVGGYRYGAMPKPPQYGRARPDVPVGAPTFPTQPGMKPPPGPRPGWWDQPADHSPPPDPTNVLRGFADNGSGAGAVTGGGYQGGGGAGDIGGNRQARQLRRQMERTTGGDTTDMTMGDPPAMGDTTNPTPGMPPSNGPNQQWRADRRKAMRQGLVEQTADGGYTSTQPADPNGQGAKRDGMGWRAERRQAVKDGTYTPPTGADRNGFGYRQDRRQAARRAANMPPAKPGQPPAM